MLKEIGTLLPETGKGLIEDSGFESFWNTYPRKTAKKDAVKAWERLSEKDRLSACAGALYHSDNNPQWRDKTLIPHPSTFLNGRRWEDEIVIPKKEEIAGDVSDIPKMVWSAMTQLFGQSWINKHGDKPSPVWLNELRKMDVERIKQGLRETVDRGEQQPPSLPYFIFLCKPADKLPEFKSLPRPESNPDIASAAFEEMNKILRKAK